MKFASPRGGKGVSNGLLLLLVVIVLGSLVLKPSELIPSKQWGAALESQGLAGMFGFVILGALATSVGLPRQLVAFIGGIAYGVSTGLPLSLLAAISGCFLTASASRKFFSKRIRQRYPVVIKRLQSLIKEDVFFKILVLRLQPLGTNLLTNVCVGFTSISLKVFLLASAIGYIPQMLVFSLLGSGVRVGSNAQFALSAGFFVVSFALGVVLYRRHLSRIDNRNK